MFKKARLKSLEKLAHRFALERDVSQRSSGLKTIGFLVNEDSFKNMEALRESYDHFGVQPKDVKVFSFVTFEKKAPSLRQDQVSNKDFSWKGVVSSQNAITFLQQPFDVLVGYYDDNNPYLDVLMAQSKAKFKVGVAKATPEIFDLLLDVTINDLTTFKTELKKYLKVLGKIE